MKKTSEKMMSFESSFRNLNFRLPPVFFSTFSFHLQILHVFLKFKTSVLSNNRFAKLFKETSFSKATMVMRFPAKKNAGWPKAPRDFPPRKNSILHPPPQSLYGRTLTSQPKFLGWIDYQISLAMGLRWRASARAPL